MKKYYYQDTKPSFSLTREPHGFRLKVELPEIEEHHVEEFLDKTVEWLSANSNTGIIIDFAGVISVCSDFTAHLARYCDEAKTKGLAVEFINVDSRIKPYIYVEPITERLLTRRTVLSISSKQVVADLRQNLSNHELMKKYGLSFSGLASLFKKLLNKGLVSHEYLLERNLQEKDPIEIDQKTKN